MNTYQENYEIFMELIALQKIMVKYNLSFEKIQKMYYCCDPEFWQEATKCRCCNIIK